MTKPTIPKKAGPKRGAKSTTAAISPSRHYPRTAKTAVLGKIPPKTANRVSKPASQVIRLENLKTCTTFDCIPKAKEPSPAREKYMAKFYANAAGTKTSDGYNTDCEAGMTARRDVRIIRLPLQKTSMMAM